MQHSDFICYYQFHLFEQVQVNIQLLIAISIMGVQFLLELIALTDAP